MNQFKLRRVCILVLVHHYVTESLLIGVKNLFLLSEEFHSLENQIVKIQSVVFL